nr:3'(2'),5'-bisphosphate nucleotidase CysQ [Spelaeicoccus albus]
MNGLRSDIGGADYEPRTLKDSGDARSHEFLMKQLAGFRPDDAVLSEEGADSNERLSADRVWIVDPLDGTREFSERSDGVWRDDWAVHVALWSKADGLIAGAVALPGRGQVFDTSGFDLPSEPGQRTGGVDGGTLKLAASRSHPPKLIDDIVGAYDVDLVRMGSAGVKTMSVITGETDAYIHAGGQYEWDSAAPVAVARAHGLHASRLDGTDLIYNRADPWLPDLFICRPALVPRITEILAAMNHEEHND